jgi:phage shock protein PspC (stress-responsive transcriptional regulator)
MKKTIQVNIGDIQFHIDEDAYKVLQQYLDALKIHFEKDGEEGKEIIADIEQRIAELLGKKITESRQVIILPDVEEIIKTLGTIEDFQFDEEANQQEASHERHTNRKLYRDIDHNYLGGVAAGLGAYFNIDPLWIRIIFIALIFLKGGGLVLYAILWLIIPKAVTTSQKLEMKGKPVTINTIEKSISDEYNKVKSSLQSWSHSDKTRNAVDSMLKTLESFFVALFKGFVYALGIIFLIAGSVFMAFLVALFFGQFDLFSSHVLFHGWFLPDLSGWMSSHGNFKLLALSLFILVFIPIVALLYTGIKIMFHIRTKNMVLRATAFTAWILVLVLFLTLLFSELSGFSVEAMDTDSKSIGLPENTSLFIDINDNISTKNTISYSIFNYDIYYNKRHETLYGKVSLNLIPESDQQKITVRTKRYLRNISMVSTDEHFDEVRYDYDVRDSVIVLDKYFEMDGEDFWRMGKVVIEISIPVNTRVRFPSQLCEILDLSEADLNCYDLAYSGRIWMMTTDGFKALE